MEAGPAKKSLRRASQDGRAQLGRASNTSGAGRAQTPARQRLDWHQTLAVKGAQPLALAHLRYRQQASGAKLVHCVLLDQSASMLRGQKLALAKGYLQALAEQAYRSRDSLCVIGFSGTGAQLLHRSLKAQAFNTAWIEPIGGGGGTPLDSALALLDEHLRTMRKQAPLYACLWLLSDGRFASLPPRPPQADQITVIDFDTQWLQLQRCQKLAQEWGAELIRA